MMYTLCTRAVYTMKSVQTMINDCNYVTFPGLMEDESEEVLSHLVLEL